MAVYKRGYEGYQGRLTPEWSRALVIARHAYRRVFDSRLMIAYLVLASIAPVVYAVLIYLPHNTGALRIFNFRNLLSIDAGFFYHFISGQAFLAFLLTTYLGPGLISADLANNALPLYFCRPFSRTEYVLGKMSVLAILLSAITWVPGLLLFAFQSYLEGFAWLRENFYIATAIFVGSWIWILLLSLLALAMSAWVKWKLAAGALIVALVFVAAGFGEAVERTLHTESGGLISILKDMDAVWFSLFRLPNSTGLPFEGAVGALFAVSALCLYLLARKIRACEVERS
jgi:ABC-2 type transport system permease protein